MAAVPFVPAPNTMQVEIRMQLDGQKVENVLHFRHDTDIAAADAAALHTIIDNWWETLIRPQVSVNLTLHEFYMTDMSTQTSPTYSFPRTPPLAGQMTGECAPNNVAFCISLRTNARGRSARGRNYITGIPVSVLTLSEVTTVWSSAIEGAYDNLRGLTSSSPWVMAIVSKRNNKEWRTTALIQPVTAVIALDNVVDSQRRRLPGRGT